MKKWRPIVGSKTLTPDDITNYLVSSYSTQVSVLGNTFIVPFIFDTPLATTTTGTWTFEVTQGAGAGDWSVRTSNATALFYAAWYTSASVAFANSDTVMQGRFTMEPTARCEDCSHEHEEKPRRDRRARPRRPTTWFGRISGTLYADYRRRVVMFGAHRDSGSGRGQSYSTNTQAVISSPNPAGFRADFRMRMRRLTLEENRISVSEAPTVRSTTFLPGEYRTGVVNTVDRQAIINGGGWTDDTGSWVSARTYERLSPALRSVDVSRRRGRVSHPVIELDDYGIKLGVGTTAAFRPTGQLR
jgi:hypothetical protein